MEWYNNLYIGESVTEKIRKVKWKIEHNVGMLHTYVIAFPSNENNLLDIIPARELQQKGYPKKKLQIIGVAGDYAEAIELVARIVGEVYDKTGDTNVSDYLCYGWRKCRK